MCHITKLDGTTNPSSPDVTYQYISTFSGFHGRVTGLKKDTVPGQLKKGRSDGRKDEWTYGSSMAEKTPRKDPRSPEVHIKQIIIQTEGSEENQS